VLHQLEITTRCNFSCFYCAGRDMPQQDMLWERFAAIVDGIPTPGALVSLQGEGEPSLHPRFFDMAAYVHSCGHEPTTILNGSRIEAARIAQHFPTVGMSLDTLDVATADRIGRHNLTKVLENLEALVAAMGSHRIVIMTVDLGQPLDALRAWVLARGFRRHVVQPLQGKADYGKRYHVVARQPVLPAARTCRFLERDVMRFYPLEGPVLPCCFIKDTTSILSIDSLRHTLAQGQVPPGCLGCMHLRERPASPLAS
jgi:MoaA/NifB/PqqE/SkfB family radical SAM enzyme